MKFRVLHQRTSNPARSPFRIVEQAVKSPIRKLGLYPQNLKSFLNLKSET